MIQKIARTPSLQTAVLANDECLLRQRTGIGHYLASLARHWPSDADVRILGLYSPSIVDRERANANHLLPPPGDLPAIRLGRLASVKPTRRWLDRVPFLDLAKTVLRSSQSRRAATLFDRGQCSVYFEPSCLALRFGGPVIATMQDLSVIKMPSTHPRDRVRFWQKEIDAAIQRTTHWITLSQATADDLVAFASIRRSDVSVIPAASRWHCIPNSWDPGVLRATLGLPDRYLLYLGTIEPRKNLLRLLDAYGTKPHSWRRATPLIFAGLPGWGDAAFWHQLQNHPMASEVQTTGYITDAQAAGVMRAASAVVYPSLYEGFGLPVVEAMGLGVPVVASNIPSVIEVANDAAILVDPMDVQGWSEAIERIVEPGRDRTGLVNRGLGRAKCFSWTRAAQIHHDLFQRFIP